MLNVKRQKLRAKELQQIKDNLLTNLPNLNKRQIRRHRIPYHEALILELIEDGFEESANFFKSLLDYQEAVYKEAEEEQILWTKPMLRNDKAMLDIVFENFKAAEIGLKTSQKGVEIDKLLELAIFFSNQIEAWWWLAEQLFMQCVSSAKDFFDDGRKRNAIVRYIFGRFLLKQMNNPQSAKEQFRLCRDICNGQNWNAGEVLKIHQGNLFKECCILYYNALLIISKEKLKTDPHAALKLSVLASKRARDAEDNAGEAECLFQQGLCEMEMNLAKSALAKFHKVLIMHFSTNNKVGICDTRIQLGLANSKLDNMSEAKYHLHQLLDYTHKHDMKYHRALGHRYLGELNLIRNIGQEAFVHLLKAIELFHALDEYDNREQAKNLAAIASGLQLIKPLMTLINSCDRKHFHYFHNVIKLVRWKDSRVEFWEEGDESDSYLKRYMEIYGEHARRSPHPSRFSLSSSSDLLPSMVTSSSRLTSRLTVTTVSRLTITDDLF